MLFLIEILRRLYNEVSLLPGNRFPLYRLFKKIQRGIPEISEGVVVDYDEDGKIVGIDIDQACEIVDLSRLEAESLPVQNFAISQAHTHAL